MNTYTPHEIADILIKYTEAAARHREAQRAYYERKKEERRAYAREYYATHRDEVIERVKRNQAQRNGTAPTAAVPTA